MIIYFFTLYRDVEYGRQSSSSRKKDKKKHKHKHKHKNKHKHSSTDRKHRKKRHSSPDSSEDESLLIKRQKIDERDDPELQKLEAARRALKAELNGKDDENAYRAIALIAKVIIFSISLFIHFPPITLLFIF